jgi:hypothetical protein
MATVRKKKELPEALVSEVMREMGRKGGRAKVPKGPATLSPERRKEIAEKAAAARWGKKKGGKGKTT